MNTNQFRQRCSSSSCQLRVLITLVAIASCPSLVLISSPVIPSCGGAAKKNGSPALSQPAPNSYAARTGKLFKALAEIESGSSDMAIGPAGEVSRFGILPRVWRENTDLSLSAAKNPFTALNVAQKEMEKRVKHFFKTKGRQPTDGEWYLLWHCPNRKQLTTNDRDLERRFSNLLTVQ